MSVTSLYEEAGLRAADDFRSKGMQDQIALPSGHPNMMGPEAHDQIPYAYGSNLARLQLAKKRYDPNGIFTSAIPLPARGVANWG